MHVMKRLAKYILCSLLLAATAAACVNDPTDVAGPGSTADPDGDVTLRFAVQFPETVAADTRAFGDKPTYSNLDLWCVVFIEDEQGIFLAQSRKATHGDSNMADFGGQDGGPLGDGTLVPFEVTLSSTQQPAIVHFIAIDKGLPDDKNPILNGTLDYGPENVIIPRLTTMRTDDGVCHDAYWQRIPLGCRISMETQEQIDELISMWSPVPMIRNFVKISVELSEELKNMKNTTTDEPWFELKGFYVVNKLTKGTIAPYTEMSGFPEFVRLHDRLTNTGEKTGDRQQDLFCRPKTYWEIIDPDKHYKTKYNDIRPEENLLPYYGVRPADWKPFDTDIPDYSENVYSAEGDAAYIYERPFSEDYHTFIVVAGIYRGNANSVQGNGQLTYYKLDIGQPDSRGVFQFYHLLRNFHYKMVITGVEANGYASATEAANGLIYNNNLSASVEAQHLLSISDGHDMMYINTTSLVIVNSEPFYLRYRYFMIGDDTLDNDDQIFPSSTERDEEGYP